MKAWWWLILLPGGVIILAAIVLWKRLAFSFEDEPMPTVKRLLRHDGSPRWDHDHWIKPADKDFDARGHEG